MPIPDNVFDFLMAREGGYVNNPSDPGGETNLGVTHSAYDSYRARHNLTKQSVKLLTKDEARIIYTEDYWDLLAGNQPAPRLAFVVFDTHVNMGLAAARTILEMTSDPVMYLNYRELLYRYLTRSATSKLRGFRKGWLNRIKALRGAIA